MLSTLAPPTPLQKPSTSTSTTCRRRYYRSPGGPRNSSPPPVLGRYNRCWRPPAPPQEAAAVRPWNGRTAWLRHLEATLRSPAGEEIRRAAGGRVSIETTLDVAHADAAAADSRTGHHVATAHATVARLLGCSPKTVQRARMLIEQLGFSATVTPGRYLTSQERAAAHQTHGGDQRRMASERALTTPPSDQNVHLPSGCSVGSSLTSRSDSPSGALTRPTRKKRSNETPRRPSLAVQRLAAGLVQRMPWLGRQHIGHLCQVLERHHVDDQGWTVADILNHIDAYDAQHGLRAVSVGSQRNPVGLFAAQLARVVAAVQSPPIEQRRREQDARAQARRSARQRLQEAQVIREARADDPRRQRRHVQLLTATRETIARARANTRAPRPS